MRGSRADFRSERAWGDGRINKQMDRQMNESPPVFYRTLSPLGPLPKRQVSALIPERADFGPERADYRQERADFRQETASFRQETADLRQETADFRSEKANIRPKRTKFGSENCCPERSSRGCKNVYICRTVQPFSLEAGQGPSPVNKVQSKQQDRGNIFTRPKKKRKS